MAFNSTDGHDESSLLLPRINDDNKASTATSTTVSLPTPVEEFWRLVYLAIPNIVVALASTVSGVLTTAKVGRDFAVVDLSAFTLANLTCNLCTLSLLSGLESASDTLAPQAYGSHTNKREVGYLAVRGLVGSTLVLVPTTTVLVIGMDRILVNWMGQDPEAAERAWHWYQIYVWGLPFYVLYNATYKFLSAQEVLWPVVVVVFLSCGVVLPLLLYEWASEFYQTAVAVVVFQVFEATALVACLWYWKPHDPATWVTDRGELWKNALSWKPLMEFMSLGMGGMLASSEWIYWEVLSLLVGSLGGVLPLSVHAIPTQVVTIYFMIPYGVAVALAVRLGASLAVSVRRAQQIAVGCTLTSSLVWACMTLVMYYQREYIFSLFTAHEDVLEGCEEIWWHVCFFSFHMGIFGVFTGMCLGLGLQWTLGTATILTMFGLGLPSTYYFAVIRKGGLLAVWKTTWPPYVLLNVVLLVAVLRVDWHKISKQINEREGRYSVERE